MEEIAVKQENGANGGEAPKQNGELDKMMEAGLHFGHKTSKTHPKMRPYITGVRNTVHILNLEKTEEKLAEAMEALGKLIDEGKTVLLVGTKVQVRDIVRAAAQETVMPYVVERWIGGLLTNFEEVVKRTAHLKDLEAKLASEEEAAKYTKWERHEMQEEVNKLEEKFGGVKHLEKLPDAMFVFDLDENQLAVKEAKHKGVQIFAISDTNTDPSKVDYAIPANDDAVSSIKFIADKVRDTIVNAKTKNQAS